MASFRLSRAFATLPRAFRCCSRSFHGFASALPSLTSYSRHESRRWCTTRNDREGKLTLGQAQRAMRAVLVKCSSPEFIEALQGIRKVNDNIMWKWNMLNSYLVPKQQEVVRELRGADGKLLFPSEQTGLIHFNQQVMAHRKNINPMVLNEWNKLWEFLLEVGFGITPEEVARAPRLPLDKARQLAIAVSQAMQSSSITKELDARLAQMPSFDDANKITQYRMRVILDLIYPLQVSIISGFGFYGEKGFILAQRAINECSDDPIVTTAVAEGSVYLFKRAGLA